MAYEVWKKILDGKFEISRFGTIRSTKSGKVIKPHVNGHGYPHVTFSFSVHGLVAEAFIGLRPIGFEIDHKDADKMNPSAENLEYVTKKENLDRIVLRGRKARGTSHGRSKLNSWKAAHIRKLHKDGIPTTRIAARFGVGRATVRQLLAGRSWR